MGGMGPTTVAQDSFQGVKIIPKISKNSRVIPEMAEKVRIGSQQLARPRNMKKIGEKSKKKIWISC